MILAIETQYHENYGDEENPHWKAKGGQTYLVTDLNDSNVTNVHINELKSLIDYANPMSEEWVIGVSIETDDYTSDYEKWQKEDECCTSIYYDTRVVRREDGTYVATDQFKGSGGEYVKIWNMAPGGEKENYSYTETLNEAVA
jgi:hypothetical protein